MSVEWHLDVVRHTDGTLYLAILDPQSGLLEREKVASVRRHETVRALRTVMLRTCPNWPDVIVTDNAQTWFGIADALGVQRRTLEPTEQRVFERIVRGLLDRLFHDDAGQPVTFAEEQWKFQSERANRAETRAERLEQLLRHMLGAQIVQPYRGWNIAALNRAVDGAREFLGLPSVRDLNPDIAKMQNAAIASGLIEEPRA